MTAGCLLLLFLLLLPAVGKALLDDGSCPSGWSPVGDVCVQPQLQPKDSNEAASFCKSLSAEVLPIPPDISDVVELLSSLFDRGVIEATWLLGRTAEGPVALSRSSNGTYTIISVPSPATFPFLCGLTSLGRKTAILQQQLGPRGAPKLIWTAPSELYFHARPDADFLPLACRVSAHPAPTINWFRNDLLIMGGNDSVLVSGGTLLVPATPSLAYSSFHCVASNKYGKVRSPSIVLKPAFLEPFSPRRQDAVPRAEGGARLDCQPPAHQPKSQSFAWLVGSTDRAVVVNERVFLSRDGNLFFSYVQPDDDARYACSLSLSSTASGHYGPFFRLRVSAPQQPFRPRIDTEFPQIFPLSPTVGNTVFIECFAYANPVAQYRWSRVDGKPFSNRVEILNHGRVLRIDGTQPSDAGRIRCSATNALGAATAEITLALRASAPDVMLPLVDSVVPTEGEFSFECLLSSSDQHSSVEWFKDATPVVPLLMPPSQRHRFVVSHNKLSVSSAHPSDAGVYQCIVSNDVGVTTSSAHISVRNTAPVFPLHIMPLKVFAQVGSNVSIPCVYQASPRGHSRWTSDGGQRIPSIGRVREIDSILYIDDILPDDQGLFFCSAKNKVGRSHAQIQLVVTEKSTSRKPWSSGNMSCEVEVECDEEGCPDPHLRFVEKQFSATHRRRIPCSTAFESRESPIPVPIGLRVDNSSDGLRLMWRMPPLGRGARDHQENGVKGYLVELRTRSNRKWRAATGGMVKESEADGLVLKQLAANEHYQFRIRPVTPSFVGDASAPSVWVRTAPAPPSSAVEDLKWRALDGNSLLLEWEPLDETAGDNLRYVVSWSEAAQSDPPSTFFAHRIESPQPQTIIRLNSTGGCRAITLAVRAVNDQGTAPTSSETVALVGGGGQLGALEALGAEALNASHVRLEWNWSNGEDCASPRIVKVVCENEEADSKTTTMVAGGHREWLIGGLKPFTEYKCHLTPTDTSGRNGESSGPLIVRTMVAPPLEAPVISEWSLRQSERNDFTTILEWTAVDLGNDTAEHVGYDIFVYISETASDAVSLRMPLGRLSDPLKPSARIDGLRLMYLYTIQVSAYNSGGRGPRSSSRVIRLGSRRDEPSSSSIVCTLHILLFLSILLW